MKAINYIGQNILIQCTAYPIQLSVNVGLQNDLLKTLTKKLREIVNHFNRSSLAKHELDKQQKKCKENKSKLTQDCITM